VRQYKPFAFQLLLILPVEEIFFIQFTLIAAVQELSLATVAPDIPSDRVLFVSLFTGKYVAPLVRNADHAHSGSAACFGIQP